MSFEIQIFSVLSTMLEVPFVFLSEKSSEKAALPESRQTFEVAAAQTSGRASQSCFLSSNWFFF